VVIGARGHVVGHDRCRRDGTHSATTLAVGRAVGRIDRRLPHHHRDRRPRHAATPRSSNQHRPPGPARKTPSGRCIPVGLPRDGHRSGMLDGLRPRDRRRAPGRIERHQDGHVRHDRRAPPTAWPSDTRSTVARARPTTCRQVIVAPGASKSRNHPVRALRVRWTVKGQATKPRCHHPLLVSASPGTRSFARRIATDVRRNDRRRCRRPGRFMAVLDLPVQRPGDRGTDGGWLSVLGDACGSHRPVARATSSCRVGAPVLAKMERRWSCTV
jgi:hypothetical protein